MTSSILERPKSTPSRFSEERSPNPIPSLIRQNYDPNTISVMTQNIYWKPRFGRRKAFRNIADAIEHHSPDFVFLQEVVFGRDAKVFEELGNYIAIYQQGKFFDCLPFPRRVNGDLLTLVRKQPWKHSIEEIALQEKPYSFFRPYEKQGKWYNQQFWDRLSKKGYLLVKVNGFKLINTHLLSLYDQPVEKDFDWQSQIAELSKDALEDHEAGSKVILAGDLNVPDDSRYLEPLLSRFKDISDGTGDSHIPDRHGDIDYIFANFGRKINKKYIDYREFTSDHRGILVKISYGSDKQSTLPVTA